MRMMESQLMKIITHDAKPTKEILSTIYAKEPEWKRKQARPYLLTTLAGMEDNGAIESRMCRTDYSGSVSRYWALPGGRYPPSLDVKALATRVVNALAIRPMNQEELYSAVYYPEERADPVGAMKRLNKALYRLQDQGMVEKETASIRATAWRLVE